MKYRVQKSKTNEKWQLLRKTSVGWVMLGEFDEKKAALSYLTKFVNKK